MTDRQIEVKKYLNDGTHDHQQEIVSVNTRSNIKARMREEKKKNEIKRSFIHMQCFVVSVTYDFKFKFIALSNELNCE